MKVHVSYLRKMIRDVLQEMKLGLTSQMRGPDAVSFSAPKDEFERDVAADKEDAFWLDKTDTSALGTKMLDIPKKGRRSREM